MAQYNVAEPFLASVRAHPDKPAVVFDGREITYRAMNDRINQMAGVLTCDFGVRPGDRVAYLLPTAPSSSSCTTPSRRSGRWSCR